MPPKSADEYELKGLPEAFNIEEMKSDPEMKSFLKSAHSKGLTNEQVNFVLNEYLQLAPKLIENDLNRTAEEATRALRDVWKNEADYGQNMGHAFRAANAIAGKAGVSFEELEKSGLGNNPLFIRLMASIGPELAEDTMPSGGQAMGAADFDAQVAELRANPAYADAKHPQHKQVMQKMEALYTKRYGTKMQKLFSGVGN